LIDPDDKVSVQAAHEKIRAYLKKQYQYNYHRYTPEVESYIWKRITKTTNGWWIPGSEQPCRWHFSYLKIVVRIKPNDALIMRLQNEDIGYTDVICERTFDIIKEFYPEVPVKFLVSKSNDAKNEFTYEIHSLYHCEKIE